VKEGSVRNLTKTLAMLSLLAPISGHTLGIGNIKLHSALNQNLNAEVSLVVSAGENASDIKVSLAPHEKFDAAGVPWASFLSKITFSTVVGAKGSILIKLSSKEAVKEPFLDFLLEVSWPKGSLYREFTVLLDPPAAYGPVLTRSETVEPKPAVILQRQSKLSRPVSAGRSLSVAREYGPTRKNDTLWKVAERAGSQADVSVEQMTIALYEENPHAFYKDNVHALSAGKTLKIPKREDALKRSKKQALVELNRQTAAWKSRSPIKTVSTKKTMPDNQLTLAAPIAAEVTENVIVAPKNEPVTAKLTVDETPPTRPKLIDEEITRAAPPIDDALQNKIVELEKQLSIMQQIAALKDQQLATIQNRPQVKPIAQTEPAQTTSEQTEVVKQKTAQTAIPPVLQPEAVSSSNTYTLWLGGSVGILSLLGWLWWRKRKDDEKSANSGLFTPSNINKAPELKDYFSTSIEKESANNADAVSASSLFKESSFGKFDIDQDEIDPVSEADVYMAVGRYQQAEELMRNVIKEQPDRDECKLKLLEIFFSTENNLAFEAYANELAQAGKKDDIAFWGKVAEMGCDICQSSTLFSSGACGYASKNNNDSIDFDLSTLAKTDESDR
jgi:pilus assembly protein FimV